MHSLVDIGQVQERRANPPPACPDELLHQLPARVLLDRMPAPAIGCGFDGAMVYANPASASMLGYADGAALLEQMLPSLLAKHSHSSAEDCIAMLREAGDTVIDWCHADGFPIHTTVSTLLLRATDPILIIYFVDITELLWVEASRSRRS